MANQVWEWVHGSISAVDTGQNKYDRNQSFDDFTVAANLTHFVRRSELKTPDPLRVGVHLSHDDCVEISHDHSTCTR